MTNELKLNTIKSKAKNISSKLELTSHNNPNFRHGQNTQQEITYEYRNWINLNHEKKLCSEWSKSFNLFFRDTGTRPQKGLILLRKSHKNPHSISNSYWGNPKLRFFKELEGQKFGLWTVLSKDLERPRIFWLCLCECGRKDCIPQNNLINGISTKCKSCAAPRPKTHGYSRNPIYLTYHAMKRRCYDEKTKCFKHYGGRGIKVCKKWLNNIEEFVKDMGIRPKGFSLERINVNGDYSPENCKWASWKDQCKNKRKISDLEEEIKRLKDIISSNTTK